MIAVMCAAAIPAPPGSMRHASLLLILPLALAGCGGGGAGLTGSDNDGGIDLPPAVASVSVTPSSGTLSVGATLSLSAAAADQSGAAIAGAAPQWQSDAPSIASVSAEGVVTAVAAGSANITATVSAGGATRSASARITVNAVSQPGSATVQGIHDGFSPATVTIAAGGTVTWVMADEEHDITWDGIAPPGGNIPRLDDHESASRSFPSPGVYTYHCDHHDSRVESGTVRVEGTGGPQQLTSVSVSPNPASVGVGATVQLTATGRDPSGGTVGGLAAATWQSSDTTRARVSATGLVTGVAAGQVMIRATLTQNGAMVTGSGTVNVGTVTVPGTATVSTVDRTFSPRSVTIAAGGTVTWQFNATHNVTFAGAAPTGGNIGNTSSGSVSRTFATPGSFSYECSLHSGMTGTVTVQ